MTTNDEASHLGEEAHLRLLLGVSREELSTDELERVHAWLAEPGQAELVDDLRRIRETLLRRPAARDRSAAWTRLSAELELKGDAPSSAGRRGARTSPRMRLSISPRRMPWFTLAAAVTVAAISLIVGSRGARGVRDARRAGSTAAAIAAPRIFVARRGQRAQLQLTDGTRVSLAADSRLTVGAAFDSLTREVTLEGEAYFDVIHDARRPFVVHVRNAVVRDVGTRFSIRAYPGDSAVRVLVTQGNVRLGRSLKGDSADALLGRGMLARIDAAGATTIRTRVDTLRYVSWTSGVLTFTSTPLREVVTELGRWYDVEFQLADSALGARRISANIGNQPLPRLLDQLAVMLDVHVSRGGRRITLTRAGGAVH